MTQDQIMKLVDAYVEAVREAEGSRQARAAVVAALEQLTKDAERYQWLRYGDNDEPVIRQYREGGSYLPRDAQLDEAIDYVIAAQKELPKMLSDILKDTL